ncbi:E3 ubiquitin-protein ligase TRIM33-like isoform X2 [Mercenaria mercenaria]|uniref:E3 ubiquitin-protein ligase TRIM33-like isoform X2 n=1 Tax=Mercenaria mercenaria TaxID=6596 RepID=UPI00234EC5F6|nr:E3 ubiquitin-protein ligase TRIM33-like isoform X2 [Mercenaria mercenaria]
MATGAHHVDTSDEIFDFTCSPCSEQNKNREAVRYCVECQDYYCQSCTDMHKMFPAMRGHKLLHTADYSSSSHHPGLPPVPTERCNNHKTKLIDMYCWGHDEVCCTSCVAENHRSCDSVTSITDVIKKSAASKETDTLIQELNTLINVCSEIKTAKETDLSEINLAKERAIGEIEKHRKEIDTLLDELENASKTKIENEYKKLLDESSNVKQKITEYESRLQKRVSALQSPTRHVTFDRCSENVYVTDNRNELVSFNKEGKYISSITDGLLDTAVGVCSDGRGSVFVGGYGSKKVIHVGADGQILGEVVGKSHRLGSICSVCFDEHHKRLVVTISNSDKIHIFDLK